MLHFVTSYMKQNKSHKETLEIAQYGLEISFKDVRANCFCASLLRTAAPANSHATSCIERAPSTKMNNDRTDSFAWI